MNTARKPWWQQATALVTVSASGVITGFDFAPAAAALTTPTSVPLHQLALEQAAQLDTAGKAPASDAQLRAAIVNVAGYYLKLAQTKTPAQVEALIWGEVSGRRHRPRAVLRRVRQPHPRTRRPGDRAAQLGHRGDHLSLAAAGLGGRAGGHQPGFSPGHLRGGRRAGARTLAPAWRRLHPSARRLGRLRRPRRGRHQLLRRRPRHHRRRLPARPYPQRPLLGRTARGPGHRRLRRQRQPPARVRQHAAPANAKAAPAKAKPAARPPRRSPACPAASRSRGRAAFPAPDPARESRARGSRRRGQYPASSPPASSSASLPRVPGRTQPARPAATSRPRRARPTSGPRPRPRSSTPRRGRGTSRHSSAWSRRARSPPSSATACPHR